MIERAQQAQAANQPEPYEVAIQAVDKVITDTMIRIKELMERMRKTEAKINGAHQ